MQRTLIVDLGQNLEQHVRIIGFVASHRDHGQIQFVNVVDASGTAQVVLENHVFCHSREDCIEVVGKVQGRGSAVELRAESIRCVSRFALEISPLPHDDFDPFSDSLADRMLSYRHLYIRNPKIMAVLRFRHKFFRVVSDWLDKHGFTEIHCPVLTQTLLYEEKTAFDVDYFGHEAYLTQCVAFYLEACVHAFDRVYSISPSFRAEPSHGRRHLAEYWHLKAELAYADLGSLMKFVEDFISSIGASLQDMATAELTALGVTIPAAIWDTPYERIGYMEALATLKRAGCDVEQGRSLPPTAQEILARRLGKPFFVVGMPTAVEPFPYVLNSDDPQFTMTADLHASAGFGEILGIAEKITDRSELQQRIDSSPVSAQQRENLGWYVQLRDASCLPHGGMGMGIERTIRWMLQLPHVRDAIPFPRLFDRTPSP